jgi:hypothetical protein
MEEMRKCIDGKLDLDKLIEETISKYDRGGLTNERI